MHACQPRLAARASSKQFLAWLFLPYIAVTLICFSLAYIINTILGVLSFFLSFRHFSIFFLFSSVIFSFAGFRLFVSSDIYILGIYDILHCFLRAGRAAPQLFQAFRFSHIFELFQPFILPLYTLEALRNYYNLYIADFSHDISLDIDDTWHFHFHDISWFFYNLRVISPYYILTFCYYRA